MFGISYTINELSCLKASPTSDQPDNITKVVHIHYIMASLFCVIRGQIVSRKTALQYNTTNCCYVRTFAYT